MAERTEEDVILQTGLTVTLGGDEYTIKPLVIRASREWRKKVIALIAPLPKATKVKIDTPADYEKALTLMLVDSQDRVISLFFEYAKDLNREEIEGKATDIDIATAFQEVMKIAFRPLAQSLMRAAARF